jgi:hypothetical protein
MPTTVCAACHENEPDPTRRSWTQKQDQYVCILCRPAVLERGLNAIAFTRDEGKGRR